MYEIPGRSVKWGLSPCQVTYTGGHESRNRPTLAVTEVTYTGGHESRNRPTLAVTEE